MDYLDVLAQLHDVLRPRTYLEIGVFVGESLRLACGAEVCVGVDPQPLLGADDPLSAHVETATSDAFFAGGRPRDLFGGRPVDLAFIDGMHLFEFALRDFTNVEGLAGPGTVIALHDCLPPDAGTAARERTADEWTGDVWKLVLCLLDQRPELTLALVDVPPSGLLLVTGLDAADETLRRGHDALVEQYAPLGFDVWEERRDEVVRRTGLALHTGLWRELVHGSRLRRRAQDEAERLHTELAAQRRLLDDMYASTSWRVSAPVRAAGRRLERLSGEARAGRTGALGRAAARGLTRLRGSAALPGAPAAEETGLDQDPLLLAAAARRLVRRPVISVLMPVYDTDARCLSDAVDSVLDQAYPEWELCVCDDGSTRPETRALVDDLPARDARIRVLRHDVNRGIAAATNTALAAASGELVAFLDHDDLLLPGALLSIAEVLERDPRVDAVYTDQASVDAAGGSPEPFRKPGWSPELFRGVMYVGHLLAVRADLVRAVGGVDPAYDNVQDFELMLRIGEATDRIVHVPAVQYLWRKVAGSVAASHSAKGGIERLQAAAVNAHLGRCGVPAEAWSNPGIPHRLIIAPRVGPGVRVSVVVLAAGAEDDLERCLGSVQETVGDRPHELIVAGGALSAAARERVAAAGGTPVSADGAEAAALSAGAAAARGEVLVFLRADLRVTTGGWLEHFLLGCHAPDVACVAPLVVSPGGRVLSAGLVLDPREGPVAAMAGWEAGGDGRAGSLSCVREVSAVPGACFAARRAVLDELGGFDVYLGSAHAVGADLSLRASARGYRNLCTPRVVVERATEEPDRGTPAARASDELDGLLLRDAWEPVWRRGDPYWPEARPREASGGPG